MGARHRAEPRPPAGERAPRQADRRSSTDRLLLLDDEPDRPAAPGVGAGEPGRGAASSTGSRSTPTWPAGPGSRWTGCSRCPACSPRPPAPRTDPNRAMAAPRQRPAPTGWRSLALPRAGRRPQLARAQPRTRPPACRVRIAEEGHGAPDCHVRGVPRRGAVRGLDRRAEACSLIDAESFLQRFTPRTRRSPWSQRNREHVARLTAAGLMLPAGLAAVEAARPTDAGTPRTPAPADRGATGPGCGAGR